MWVISFKLSKKDLVPFNNLVTKFILTINFFLFFHYLILILSFFFKKILMKTLKFRKKNVLLKINYFPKF